MTADLGAPVAGAPLAIEGGGCEKALAPARMHARGDGHGRPPPHGRKRVGPHDCGPEWSGVRKPSVSDAVGKCGARSVADGDPRQGVFSRRIVFERRRAACASGSCLSGGRIRQLVKIRGRRCPRAGRVRSAQPRTPATARPRESVERGAKSGSGEAVGRGSRSRVVHRQVPSRVIGSCNDSRPEAARTTGERSHVADP